MKRREFLGVLSNAFVAKVDTWVAQQSDAPIRTEAIRRLVEPGLKAKEK